MIGSRKKTDTSTTKFADSGLHDLPDFLCSDSLIELLHEAPLQTKVQTIATGQRLLMKTAAVLRGLPLAGKGAGEDPSWDFR
jgi:hypothetical protein